MQRKLFLGGLVLGAFLAFAPTAIRLGIEVKYPGVKVDSVRLGWPLRCLNVTVVREGLQAELREVQVTPLRSDPVMILGGTVYLARKKGEGRKLPHEGREIFAKDLQVTVDGDGYMLRVEGVAVTSSEYTFREGTATYRQHRVTMTSGGASKDLKTLILDSASVELELPFDLPKIPSHGFLQINGVKVSGHTVNIDRASYGPITALGVSVQEDEKLTGLVSQLEVKHPWIAVDPVTFRNIGFSVPLPISTAQLTLNGVAVQADPLRYHVRGSASCGAWVGALPEPLPDALKGTTANWSGDLSFEAQAKAPAQIHMTYDCKYLCTAEPIKSLKSKVVYQAYNSKGGLFERTVGKGYPGWTSLHDLPPHIPKAVVTLEDPGFMGHRGVIVQAIQNSLQDNLKLGEFFRGGSTITQQLAKNLWLRRHKTLSRKVYEAMLAMALESCLTKEEILELYLNVVEFGPDLYGIGPATDHYFHKRVGELSVEEGFYLAALLPHPSKALPPDKGGIEAATRLMRNLVTTGLLSDVYLPGVVSSDGWETTE